MSIGSKYLTQPDLRSQPGMAHFAGTGPEGKTCGQCAHYGFYRESKVGKSYRVSGCGKYQRLTGHPGPAFHKDTSSCKYFEPKPTERS